MVRFSPYLSGFECASCGGQVRHDAPAGVCAKCASPLLCRYDLEAVRRNGSRDRLLQRPHDLWRYGEVLPFMAEGAVRLGEGGTPLVPLPALAAELGVGGLWLKEETPNPTLSFKARGLCMAVNGALAWNQTEVALPSAGNAGSAAAAYAALAGIGCSVFVPDDTPECFVLEQQALGAHVTLVAGTIAEAGRALSAEPGSRAAWNVSTFREPFRVEGKKTLGYEIAEQSEWHFPDFIFYPTGGGTGLVGMWLAFRELSVLGWCQEPMPRLIAVQAEGCAPIVRAWEEGRHSAEPWRESRTLALGLRVPSPLADRLILQALRESRGAAVAVSEEEMLGGMRDLARRAGCLACPEGGATLAAARKLCAEGSVSAEARVVIFNTGSGLKYRDAWAQALRGTAS